MHSEKKTPKSVEKEAGKGYMMIHEMEYLEREDPKLVTETTKKLVYQNELKIRLHQAVGGFEHGACTTSIECLQNAEKAVTGAKEKGYEIDEASFNNAITEIYGMVRNQFFKSQDFLNYLKNCSIDFKEEKQELEENLPNLARKQVSRSLKRSRQAAKNLRRVCKSNKDLVGRLVKGLEGLEEFKSFGINYDSKVEEIKEIAYQRGVEFVINRAMQEVGFNPEKTKRLLSRAKRNAKCLGRDVSYQVEEFETLYAL